VSRVPDLLQLKDPAPANLKNPPKDGLLYGTFEPYDRQSMTRMTDKSMTTSRRIAETKQLIAENKAAYCPWLLKFTNQQSTAAQSMLEALEFTWL
jgi:hypothetical protein